MQKNTSRMSKDINNPKVIIFFKEMYEKEKVVRAQWLFKHQDKVMLATKLHREPTNYYETDVVTANMRGGIPTIARDNITASGKKKRIPPLDREYVKGIESIQHTNTVVNIGVGDAAEDPRLARPDTDLTLDPLMRPVDRELQSILLKPKPMFGRERYLKLRADIWPEKKYYLPECTNWEYGWRLGDSEMKQMPKFGRCWLLNRSLRNRTGPQPDPAYYRSAEIPGVSKCLDL